MPTSEIRAEWAAQRISGLSFFSAARAAFFGNEGNKVKSLISEFNYPRFGPGQMWDAMTAAIEAEGGEVLLRSPVVSASSSPAAASSRSQPARALRASRRRHLVAAAARDRADGVAARAASSFARRPSGLRYRDFISVALVVDGEDLFPDNWIYIHEPSVRVGRIQNFRSWSPWMVPDPTRRASGSSTSASRATTSGR